MGITACIVFYNDRDLLEKCLNSLQGKVDRIVLVDGAYEDFPHEIPWSTDGSVELAKQYGTVVETSVPWKTEVDKRNFYLQFVPDDEYFLVIDTDEELCSSIEPEGKGLNVIIEPDGGKPYSWPRVFKKTPGWHYYKTHMTYKDNEGLVYWNNFKTSQILIKHHQNRSEERKQQKEIFRKKLNELELKDREWIVKELGK